MELGHEIIKDSDFRRPVQIGLMALVILLLVLHGTAESLFGIGIMAFMEGGLALYIGFVLYLVLRLPYSHKLAAAFVLPLLAAALAAMFHPQTPSNVFVWTFLFPVLSYALLGRKLGFRVTLACSLLALTAYLSKTSSITEGANPLIISDVVMCMCVIWVVTHLYERFRESSVEAFHLLATTDELTGLQNRRQMKAAFTHLASEADRQQRLLAVVVMDLDYFKKINDHWGHDAGDAVLIHVAKLLLNSIRKSDWVFRIGGEEFCLLIPVVDYSNAMTVAESIRHTIESTPCHYNGEIISLSASIGFAIYPEGSKHFDSLLVHADHCMYRAKQSGRNRVVGFSMQRTDHEGLITSQA